LPCARKKLDVSFWDFLKVGAVAMPIALLASLGGAIFDASVFGIFRNWIKTNMRENKRNEH